MSQVIGADGLQKLCNDMNIDLLGSAEILVFMWLCECETYGQITEREFQTGFDKMGFSTMLDLQEKAANKLNMILKDPESSDFRKFFKFAFIFHREGMYKNVEFSTCKALLKMIFGEKFKTVLSFIKYCEERQLQVLTLDQWESLLDVVKTTGDDISKYDRTGAWPTLLDDFYEWN